MKLHAYQEVARDWLIERKHAALFLEPGLGKTVSTISALAELHMLGEVGRVLIVAPKRVATDTWPEELEKWGHLHSFTHAVAAGGVLKKRLAGLDAGADITITGAANLVWLIEEVKERGGKWPFDTLVIDELSMFKGRKSQRTRALRDVIGKFQRRYGLTGTPAPNSLLDIWPQVCLLDGGKSLGAKFTPFKNEHFELGIKPNGQYKDQRFDSSFELREGHDEVIYEWIRDLAISMRTADHLELPERTDPISEIRLTPALAAEYKRFQREKVMDLYDETGEVEVTAANAAVLSNKLLQFTAGAVYDDDKVARQLHTLKTDRVLEIVEELQGSPAMIFYTYQFERDALLEALGDRAEEYGDGSSARWNAGEIPVLLLHPQAAGHGLNLQRGGNTIIWTSLTWSSEQWIQANARLHRQGQKSHVVVHKLIVPGTVDERVNDVLTGKVTKQDALMDALRAAISVARS